MKHIPSTLVPRIATLLLALAPLAVRAKTPMVQIVPAATVAPATTNAPPETVTPSPPESGKKPEKEAKPKDLASALPSMKFKRTPEALLEATLAQRKGGDPSPADAFLLSVLYGDWAAVGKALAELPAEPAAAGYARLLDTLAELPDQAAQLAHVTQPRA